jgi:hypothetical protein
LSSATTELHTVANDEPGSSVNDRSPWSESRARNELRRRRICPHSYPQVWTGQSSSSRSLSAQGRGLAGNPSNSVSSGFPPGLCPHLVIADRVNLKRLWQKLTVFRAGANRSATFRSQRHNDAPVIRDGCDGSKSLR